MSVSPDALSGSNASTNTTMDAASILHSTSGKSIVTVLIILAFTALADRFLSPSLDAQEPPVLKPWIPLIGHIIDMIRHGNLFLTRLG